MEPVHPTDVSNAPQVSCSARKVGVESLHQSKVVQSMTISIPIDARIAVLTACSSMEDAISNHKIVKFQIKINNVLLANLALHLSEATAIHSKYKTAHLAHFQPQDSASLFLLKTVSGPKEIAIHALLVTH
jgi:hypothetical protein